MKPIVFTDLDGSLLDNETYSFEASKPALEIIFKRQMPLIFVTSKTRPEVEQLQIDMGISEPFIVENGAAVYFPSGYRGIKVKDGLRESAYTVIRIGEEYAAIRKFVESVKERFKIRGFGDMLPKEIASLAGLSEAEAIQAKMREFTEPFVMEDISVLLELKEAAKVRGLIITRGGRFFHLMGKGQDKGRAVEIATQIISKNLWDKVVSIGIGDSANDIPMLKCVDIPVLIPHPDGRFENLDIKNLMRAGQPGSKGWNQIMIDILSNIVREPVTP
ncbi:MAG: HAD-IIB family hydrolase [Proteobacteria bacterium]|nr:HAD-IIB family hydrolase [Pseudomonadota bacterium]